MSIIVEMCDFSVPSLNDGVCASSGLSAGRLMLLHSFSSMFL